MQIQIGRISEGNFCSHDIDSMHQLRYQVFRERLQWDVQCEGRSELDDFDNLDPTYMLVKNDEGRVNACWRMLPTTGPYMMKDTFSQVLCGQQCPQDESVWELSRFAMGSHHGLVNRFCDTAILMMEKLMEFALSRDLKAFVTVTTVGIERLMRSLGVPMRRYGAPIQIGIEKTVGFSIDVSRDTLELLQRRRLSWQSGARLAS